MVTTGVVLIQAVIYVFHFSQMAFAYVVMQSLPPTLLEFENCTNAVCTLADILYGRKKYVHFPNI